MTVNNILAEIWDFFKKNFAILLIGVLFLLFYGKGCGNKSGEGITKTDTVTKVEQIPQPIVVMPSYTPQQAGGTTYVTIPSTAQGVIPASTMEGLIAQVKDLSSRIEQLGKQYYAIKKYDDNIILRDSVGTDVGNVNLKQIVSENTLQSTQPTYQLKFPTKTITITNTVTPPKKNQVFVGVGVESLLNKPSFNQVEAGLLLKNKRDVVIGMAGTYNIQLKSPGIKLSLYKKISL